MSLLFLPQHLKAVQNQITSLSAKDNKTSKDQQTLQKLYKEQQSILLSGKIVPTIPGQHAQGLTFVSFEDFRYQVPLNSLM